MEVWPGSAYPLGATFAAYTTSNPLPPGYPKQGPGLFCWEELLTTDPKRMVAFYGEVFGWTHETVTMPIGPYHILKAGDAPLGGVMQMPPGAPARPHIAPAMTKAARRYGYGEKPIARVRASLDFAARSTMPKRELTIRYTRNTQISISTSAT